jgi:hypothetical protein
MAYANNMTTLSDCVSTQKSFISCASSSRGLRASNCANNEVLDNETYEELDEDVTEDVGAYVSASGCWRQQTCGYYIQYPYNLKQCERYSESGTVKDFLVYSDDKPFNSQSKTLPRTELRVQNCDMTNGRYRFTASFNIPCTTYGTTFFQVFDQFGTFIQLRTYGDSLSVNNNVPIFQYQRGVYHKLDVSFTVTPTSKRATIKVDSVQIYDSTVLSNSGESFYFKCGSYLTSKSSNPAEVYIKNLKILKYQ